MRLFSTHIGRKGQRLQGAPGFLNVTVALAQGNREMTGQKSLRGLPGELF